MNKIEEESDRYKMTKRKQGGILARSMKLELACNIDVEVKVERKKKNNMRMALRLCKKSSLKGVFYPIDNREPQNFLEEKKELPRKVSFLPSFVIKLTFKCSDMNLSREENKKLKA